DFLKKNKLIVGVIAVILLVLVGFLGFNMLRGGSSNDNDRSSRFQDQDVREVDPSEIGLDLRLRDDKQAVIITATKIDGIESLEYELTYDAEVEEGGRTAVVPRGAVGELSIGGNEASAEVDLGTCSSGVCKYDTVVSDVNVLIK